MIRGQRLVAPYVSRAGVNWCPKSIHRTRFDAIAMLEHDAFDYVYRTTSSLVIDKIIGMMGSADLTEPNWAILGEYIEKPVCRLMRKSRRKGTG